MSEIDQQRQGLRRYTTARVSLPQAGAAIGTRAQLEFQLDHALARDAVHAEFDEPALLAGMAQLGLQLVALRSAVEPGPAGRAVYLRRPDLGRMLSEESKARLAELPQRAEVVFAVVDGLSALAVERHALPLLQASLPLLDAWRIGPVALVQQGRVAIGDAIGEALRASIVVLLIGERPGLSAPDSLGVYLTWAPRAGRTDAERNCISNIRAGGLSYPEAAARLAAYMIGARSLGASGVQLKMTADLSAGSR